MIISIFKGGHPAGYVIGPILLIAIAITWGTGNVIRPEYLEMPLYQAAAALLSYLPAWAITMITLSIIGTQAFHWNKIVADYEVLYKKSLLPLLLFIGYAVSVPDFFSINPALLVTSILLVICEKLFSLYKNPSPLRIVFDTAFWSAVACLIWFPAIALFLFVLVSWIILKNVNGRDLLVGIIGFLLPFFLTAVFLFWMDTENPIGHVFPILDSTKIFHPFQLGSNPLKWLLVVYGSFVLFAAWRINRNFYKNATRVRLFQQAVYLLFVFTPLAVFLGVESRFFAFYPLVIPISLMLSYHFLLGKSVWWNEVMFVLFAIAIFLISSGWIR
jgi:hypothetical protein